MTETNKEQMLENKIELLQEDLESIHMYLDGLNIPRADEKDTYSIVGRIQQLLKQKISIMEKLILVHYINIGNAPAEEVHNRMRNVQEMLSKQEGIISYVVPIQGETRIDCINPKLVSEEEYKKAQEVLDRNQKIVDDILKWHESSKTEN